MSHWVQFATSGITWGLALSLVIAPLVFFLVKRAGSFRGRGPLSWALLSVVATAYLSFLGFFTQSPLSGKCSTDPLRLTLGNSVMRALPKWEGLGLTEILVSHEFLQIAGNVALLMPVGLFWVLALKGKPLGATVAGFVVSLTIEILQITGLMGVLGCAHRIMDVDDLLTNTLGALIASTLAYMLKPAETK